MINELCSQYKDKHGADFVSHSICVSQIWSKIIFFKGGKHREYYNKLSCLENGMRTLCNLSVFVDEKEILYSTFSLLSEILISDLVSF